MAAIVQIDADHFIAPGAVDGIIVDVVEDGAGGAARGSVVIFLRGGYTVTQPPTLLPTAQSAAAVLAKQLSV